MSTCLRRYLDLLARGRLADVAHAAFYAEDDDARALAAAFVAEKRADLGGGDGASPPPDPAPRAAGPSLWCEGPAAHSPNVDARTRR